MCTLAFQFPSQVAVPVLCVHDLHHVRIYRNMYLRIACHTHDPLACPWGIALPPCDCSPGLASAGTYAAAAGASACVDCGAGKFPRPPGFVEEVLVQILEGQEELSSVE